MITQRVQTLAKQKRLTLSTQWKADMDNSYALDPRRIFFTDEKVFAIGSWEGGSRNYPVRVHNATVKGDVPRELLRRKEGEWQGGVEIICNFGVSRR